MDNRRIVKNIGILFFMKPISILMGFIYTPLVLAFLGDVKYGIWAIILNILSWINYFDIGIGNGLRNRLTEAITVDDKEKAKRLVSTAYVGTAVISILFFVIITIVWYFFNLSEFFKLSLEDEDTNIVILVSVLLVSINFVLSLSKTSAYAIQQPGMISVVGVVGQAFQIGLILLIPLFCNQNLFVIATMYGMVSLTEGIFVYLLVTRKRDYLKPKVALAQKKYLKPLLSLGVSFFVIQICSLVLNTTDNLMISGLYGSAEVTPYSLVYKVFYLVVQVHAIVIMPMWSAYTEAATRKDMEWIKKTMKRINQLTFVFSFGIIVGIVFFEPAAEIWLHRKMHFEKSLIIVVAVYMIVQMIGNNYASFLCGVGHLRTSTILSGIGAVLNIPLSFFFAKTCGMRLTGIIMGSLVVMVAGAIVLPITSRIWIKKKSAEWRA